ncbi:hypothetical protein Tco_0561505 [Tanacetum coccineum]
MVICMLWQVEKPIYFEDQGKSSNLIPPKVEGSRGRVIREPELDIFYYNGNFDLAFQSEEEFHLASIAQLIRIKDGIQRGTPEAEEMFKKMEMAIEAMDDVIQARKIVQDNLDGLGMYTHLASLINYDKAIAIYKLLPAAIFKSASSVALSTEKGNGNAGWNSDDAFSSSFLNLSSEVVAARWGYGSMIWKCSYVVAFKTHKSYAWNNGDDEDICLNSVDRNDGSLACLDSSCDEVVSGRGIGLGIIVNMDNSQEEYTPVTRHHKPKNNNSYTRKQLVYDNCGDKKLRSLFDISPTPKRVYDDIKATGEKKTFCSIECRSMQIAQMEEESIKKKTMMRNKHDCGSSTSYSPQQIVILVVCIKLINKKACKQMDGKEEEEEFAYLFEGEGKDIMESEREDIMESQEEEEEEDIMDIVRRSYNGNPKKNMIYESKEKTEEEDIMESEEEEDIMESEEEDIMEFEEEEDIMESEEEEDIMESKEEEDIME